MRLMLLFPILALAACVEKEKLPSGAEDFATFCSACHGAGGKGDGDAAAVLDRKPADLTGLSARIFRKRSSRRHRTG